MSPASSGSLEVEKYIGACLISQNRPKSVINTRDLFFPRERLIPDIYPGNYVNFDGRYRIQRCNSVDRWAGGMPLISFANHQRRGKRPERQEVRKIEEQPNPLTRLAIHTQGAPLILTKTYNHRKNKIQKSTPPSKSNDSITSKTKSTNDFTETQHNVGVDTVSVTSDESSGSANSDKCLPRIIKPRKRRKKDRKPPLLGRPLSQDGFSTDSASPDIDTSTGITTLRPYIPFLFDPHVYRLVPENLPLSDNQSLTNDKCQMFNDVSETPRLHHTFEDVKEVDDSVDVNGNQSTTVCQCRYCDPAGQIWDVERNCFSPFLTAPVHGNSLRFSNLNVGKYSPPTNNLSSLSNSELSYCLAHSMSAVSLEEEKDLKSSEDRSFTRPSRDLEVSTEIVTSLNGHRDLEIKFFSSPSTESVRTIVAGEIKNSVAKPGDKLSSRKMCENEANEYDNNKCKFVSEE